MPVAFPCCKPSLDGDTSSVFPARVIDHVENVDGYPSRCSSAPSDVVRDIQRIFKSVQEEDGQDDQEDKSKTRVQRPLDSLDPH